MKTFVRTPHFQLAAASVVMLGGAYLVGLWMLGLVLFLQGLLWGADALLRHVKDPDEDLSSHQAILKRYQRSP